MKGGADADPRQLEPLLRQARSHELDWLEDTDVFEKRSRSSRRDVESFAAAHRRNKVDPDADDNEAILTIRDAVFYQYTVAGELLYWSVVLLTAGLFALVAYWHPWLETAVRYRRVAAASDDVDCVLVLSLDRQYTICPIMVADPAAPENGWLPLYLLRRVNPALAMSAPRSFEWRHARLWLEPGTGGWTRFELKSELTGAQLHAMSAERALAASAHVATVRRLVAFGRNELDIRIKPLWQLILLELLRPFVCFQFFAIGVWYAQEYTLFASIILCLTVIALVHAGVSRWLSLRALQRLGLTEGTAKRVHVVDGRLTMVSVPAAELVPGDVIAVASSAVMQCDAALLSGSCIVSESMLTGESTPVRKSPLPVDPAVTSLLRIDADRDARYILFSGTTVLQAKAASAPPAAAAAHGLAGGPPYTSLWDFYESSAALPALAVVLRTGFSTARGQLVRAILFPKPMKFDFESQSTRFIWILLGGLCVGIVVQVTIYAINNAAVADIILDLLNLVTIAVPPALPLALSFGLVAAFARLKQSGIFCATTNRISAAGRVNMLVFDKTGTLTEDGLAFHSILPATMRDGARRLGEPRTDVKALAFSDHDPDRVADRLADILVGCHALSVLEPDEEASGANAAAAAPEQSGGVADAIWGAAQAAPPPAPGVLVGDPLELSMFQRTGWRLSMRPPPLVLADGIWHHTQMPASVVEAVVPPADAGSDCAALAIVRRFDFDAELRRMSTLVLRLPTALDGKPMALLLLKGAPESVHPLCTPQSLPEDVDARLAELTMRGLRVLACAYRVISLEDQDEESVAALTRSTRAEAERDLTFAGLLVMENRLKDETIDCLCDYARAGLRLVMATGDNALTAVAVAKQCGPTLVRPWRSTLLLDADASGALVLSPASEASAASNDAFASGPVPLDALLAARGPSDALLMDGTSRRPPALPPGFPAEIDLAVTGRAFDALLHHHSGVIARRREMAAAGAGALLKHETAISPLEAVLSRAAVFARMSPHNKQELVRALQDMAYVVCMTGDGANDANALKAADVGISIAARAATPSEAATEAAVAGALTSEQAASVAAAPSIAAPFSTRLHHIDAVRLVLTEGRCALVTSFTLFKFMFEYGVTQFLTVLIVYAFLLELADNQYIYEDIILVLSLCAAIPLLTGVGLLSRGKPECNLVAPGVLRSASGHVLILAAFQLIQVFYLQSQSFYEPPPVNEDDFDRHVSMLGACCFLFANFQYTFLALTFCQSFGVYRQPVYANWRVGGLFVLQFTLSTLLVLFEWEGFGSAFSIVYPPFEYRVKLVILALVNGALHMLYERIAVPHESDDEEPVLDMDELEDALDQFNGFKRIPRANSGVDCQPTLLPKLRSRAPLYHQLGVLARPMWSATAP